MKICSSLYCNKAVLYLHFIPSLLHKKGLLGVPVNDSLLIVKTSAYLEDQDIIEYTYSQYRADRYEYHTMHTFVR